MALKWAMAIQLIRSSGATTTLTFSSGGVKHPVLVDTDRLLEVVSFPYSWCIHSQGNGKVYAVSNVPRASWDDQYTQMLHRFVLRMDPEDRRFVDHKNGNTLDDRVHNLRPTTNSQNQMNRQGANSNSRSGYKGVTWHDGRKRWRAQARVNWKSIHLGYFKDMEGAIGARLKFDQEYWEQQFSTSTKEGIK